MRFIIFWMIVVVCASLAYAGYLHPYKLPKRVLIDDKPQVVTEPDKYLKQSYFIGVEESNILFEAKGEAK